MQLETRGSHVNLHLSSLNEALELQAKLAVAIHTATVQKAERVAKGHIDSCTGTIHGMTTLGIHVPPPPAKVGEVTALPVEVRRG